MCLCNSNRSLFPYFPGTRRATDAAIPQVSFALSREGIQNRAQDLIYNILQARLANMSQKEQRSQKKNILPAMMPGKAGNRAKLSHYKVPERIEAEHYRGPLCRTL